MLTADYLDSLSDSTVELYENFQQSVINDLVRRLIKLGSPTATAAWQMQRLSEAGFVYEDIIKKIAEITGQSEKELIRLFNKAGVKATTFDNAIYKAAGLDPTPLNLSPMMYNVLVAGINKTAGSMRNLTLTTAISGQEAFLRAADQAYMQVITGTFDYNTAIRNAVTEVGSSGLDVIYQATGHRDRLDVAMRRSVLTGVNQTVGQIKMAQMDEMGVDLVQTSAHIGARNKGTGPANHEGWQGKIFSRSGRSKRYPDFVQETGYGTVTGLMGINCVLGDTKVSGPRISTAYHRQYSGEIVIIRTARGHELTITPGHPILTPCGWVSAGKLKQGDVVVSLSEKVLPECKIEDFFSAVADENPTELISGNPSQFHGDGMNGEKTKIVYLSSDYTEGEQVERYLGNAAHQELVERCDQAIYLLSRQAFHKAGIGHCRVYKSQSHQQVQRIGSFFGQYDAVRTRDVLPYAFLDTSDLFLGGLPGSRSYTSELVPCALCDVLDTTAFSVRGGLPDEFRSIFLCESNQSCLNYTRDLGVTQDEIISIEVCHFSGEVYNLETKGGWYFANNIITHNCRHNFYPFFEGISENAYSEADRRSYANKTVTYNGEEISFYEATQKQRAIERKIREWKRQAGALEAGGLDNTREIGKVRQWQGMMREFVKQTKLNRQYVRERI